MKIPIGKLKYEYVFKDTEQLEEQIQIDLDVKYPKEKNIEYELQKPLIIKLFTDSKYPTLILDKTGEKYRKAGAYASQHPRLFSYL